MFGISSHMRRLKIIWLLAMSKLITVVFVIFVAGKVMQGLCRGQIMLSAAASLLLPWKWGEIIGDSMKSFVSPYCIVGLPRTFSNTHPYAYMEEAGTLYCFELDTAVEIKMRHGGEIVRRYALREMKREVGLLFRTGV